MPDFVYPCVPDPPPAGSQPAVTVIIVVLLLTALLVARGYDLPAAVGSASATSLLAGWIAHVVIRAVPAR